MSALSLLAHASGLPQLQATARVACGLAFLMLLGGLGWALLRARKQVRDHAAEAALEASFLELERALSTSGSEASAVARGTHRAHTARSQEGSG